MVRVKRFQIRAGGKVYTPGMTIPSLSAVQEQRLVDDGYCEYVEVPGVQGQAADASAVVTEHPEHPPEGPALPTEPVESQGEPAEDDPLEQGPATEHPVIAPRASRRGRKK